MLSQVAVADGQVARETVPGLAVPVLEVVLEPVAEIRGQPHVIELPASIQGVHTLASANVGSDDPLVLLQRLARDVFQVLANQLCAFAHATTPEGTSLPPRREQLIKGQEAFAQPA